MRVKELREMYLRFFKEKKHAIIPSESLIPEHDPTALFTSAGMHPLVPFLLGQPHPRGNRLANCQKCIRTTDIDEVGDPTHLTFFEMLGNWSLGDYWKKEAITWSYEFLTDKKWLGFDPEKLSVTIFAGDEYSPRDDESIELWKSVGIPEERIYHLPREDNWWGPVGDIGPCGPCTEMFIELDNVPACGPECKPGCECGHYFEVWNDVFMFYNQVDVNKFEKLKQHNVDTGMGVERTAAMLQGATKVYDIETFIPLITKIKERAGKEEYSETDETYVHIIADHIRAAVMIMADDRQIAPSNVEQGYIVRRLIRKSVFSADQLGLNPGFLPELVDPIIEIYEDLYDEVKRNREFVIKNLKDEESKFRKTLNKALRKLNKILTETGTITGEDAFLLFTSYGLPSEMTREIAEENGIKVDMNEFQKQFEEHREISRTATQGKFKSGLADHSEIVTRMHTATHILQEALRRVLGDSVQQMGSNITPERLRFDFSFDRKLTQEEIKEVEDLVNGVITEDIEVTREIMEYDTAIKAGALAFFKETYDDEVSVYRVGDFSMELCGGPHVTHTGVIGVFKIEKQKKIGANIVRIRAVLEG